MEASPHGAAPSRARSSTAMSATMTGEHHVRDMRPAPLAAIVTAAGEVGVEPAALSRPAYREICRDRAHAALPSALAISALFGGWERAREQVEARSRITAGEAAGVVV